MWTTQASSRGSSTSRLQGMLRAEGHAGLVLRNRRDLPSRPSSSLREPRGRLGGCGSRLHPSFDTRERMIAEKDPAVDLADQESAAAAGEVPPAPRNSPLYRRNPDPQAPQPRKPRRDRSAGISSGLRGRTQTGTAVNEERGNVYYPRLLCLGIVLASLARRSSSLRDGAWRPECSSFSTRSYLLFSSPLLDTPPRLSRRLSRQASSTCFSLDRPLPPSSSSTSLSPLFRGLPVVDQVY